MIMMMMMMWKREKLTYLQSLNLKEDGGIPDHVGLHEETSKGNLKQRCLFYTKLKNLQFYERPKSGFTSQSLQLYCLSSLE